MGYNSGIHWTDDTFNPWHGCTNVSPACDNCLIPDTPVLYADLSWRPLGDARVGDTIIALDEQALPGSFRHLRQATIEAVWWSRKPATRLTTTSRETIGSDEHRWLRKGQRRWVPTRVLQLGQNMRSMPVVPQTAFSPDYMRGYLFGMTLGDGTFRYIPGQRSDKLGWPQPYWRVALTDSEPLGRLVSFLAYFGVEAHIKPFLPERPGITFVRQAMQKVEVRALTPLQTILDLLQNCPQTADFRLGWLAGFFDAEGGWSGDVIRVSQVDPTPLVMFDQYAHSFGFTTAYELTKRSADNIRLEGRLAEKIRFLSLTRPATQRKLDEILDRRCEAVDDELVATEPVGMRDLVDIQTSTGTFWANGWASHNCYAETFAHRMKSEVWGHEAPRRFFGDKHWNEPLKWNRQAEISKARRRCFSGSMCDIMERRDDLIPHRQRLFQLVEDTKWLDWLLLTKRPQEFTKFLPQVWLDQPLDNVWLMTTVESADYLWRIKAMMEAPAVIYGVSMEPLLSAVTLPRELLERGNRAWVIVGGESGAAVRQSEVLWIRWLRDQCIEAGVPFHFKQWGEYGPVDGERLVRLGVEAAGRLVDGREWNEMPESVFAEEKAA